MTANAVDSSPVPSDCVDVRASQYGAIGDAVESFCFATVSGSPANTLTIFNFSGMLSLVQLSAETARLTIVGAFHTGLSFQPYDVGKQLYLVSDAYTLQAPILDYIDGQTVILTAGDIAPLSGANGTLTWPCFQAFNENEYLVFDGMGQNQVWPGNFSSMMGDPTLPYGQQAFIAQIKSVIGPNQITIATTFPFGWNASPAHLRWGANDANAVALAGQAAFRQGKRKIYFSGDGNLFLLLGICRGDAGRCNYMDVIPTDAGAALNGVLWLGDNVKTFTCDPSGLNLPHGATQIGSDSQRLSDRSIYGRGSFRRCSRLSSINLFVIGDSQSCPSPQNQASAWMQTHKFVEEFKRANAGKTVKVYYMGLGGTTFAILASPTLLINNANNQTYHWNIPRPISGAPTFMAFVANANQTGSGPAIVPDCVAIFENGGNDAYNMDGASMQSLINQIRAISHSDGHGPTDIVLQTDHQATTLTTNSGNTGGVVLSGVATRGWYYEYSAGLIRTTAHTAGYGCVDLGPLVTRACFGYDPMHRAMRGVPSMDVLATPSAPLALPYRCSDFSFWFLLPGSSDAAVWRTMRQLDFQVSVNPGNKVMLRYGINGNLWLGVSSWGQAVPTICTIARDSNFLTVGDPVTLTGFTMTQKRNLPQIGTSPHVFDGTMAGKCIITPTRRGNAPQRNFVRGVIDGADVTLHENAFSGGDIVAVQNSSLTIGGAQFVPQDSTTQSDIVIFYPDGTIWNTQVAAGGYISLTQAMLASPAPQALSDQAVQVFIGRMSVKWFDTGLNLSSIASTGTFEINVNRGSLVLMYMAPPLTNPYVLVDIPIERFGATFYPIVTPHAPQQIRASNMWIDTDKSFLPVATPWEIRGIPDANSDFYLGGVGGHPSSRLRTDVTDIFYQNQDLCTY